MKSSASATSDQPMTGTSASSGISRPARSARPPPGRRGAAGLAGVDRVAVEAQRGDEAPLGVVGLEDLDVRGVVDALGGQGGDAVAVDDWAHMGCRCRRRSSPHFSWAYARPGCAPLGAHEPLPRLLMVARVGSHIGRARAAGDVHAWPYRTREAATRLARRVSAGSAKPWPLCSPRREPGARPSRRGRRPGAVWTAVSATRP